MFYALQKVELVYFVSFVSYLQTGNHITIRHLLKSI